VASEVANAVKLLRSEVLPCGKVFFANLTSLGASQTSPVEYQLHCEKLEGVSDSWGLKTVWGVGYKFEVTAP
jgi:hypothetical protein